MRWMLAFALALFSLAANATWDGTGPGPGLTGNDTGGIIQWTPEIAGVYHSIAAAHCARWNRIAEITSVHPHYGDYVGFRCAVDRRNDPRKAWLAPYYVPAPPVKP
jgi:hypothetical protein